MSLRLRRTIRQRPLHEQVMVITGASSGIGLANARAAAAAGVTLVIAARSGTILERVAAELRAAGAPAVTTVVCDVGNEDDVRRLEAAALEAHGRVDTWVNNAGISVYGSLKDVPIAEQRRLFETDYWGVVHGSLAAARIMRHQGGGTIITVGSALSDRAIPLQVTYSAAKHAVKGFTDGLRMELMREGAPIAVTLIKPASVDTPYKEHAGSHLEDEPTNPPPVYDVALIADAILYAATHRVRALSIGGASRLMTLSRHLFPGLSDVLGATVFANRQHSGARRRPGGHAGLFDPSGHGQAHNDSEGYVRRVSTYLFWQKNRTVVLGGVVVLAGVALLGCRRSGRL